jgi:hypothetical protein
MPASALAAAQRLGLLDSHIFFYEQWVPYAERASFLLEADIAIWLHHQNLETVYAAVRSRFLDHLWAGLPSIISDGDAAAHLVQAEALGYVIMPGAIDEVAHAATHLIANEQQRWQFAHNARRIAQRYTWERVLEPLARFCAAPVRTRTTQIVHVPNKAEHFDTMTHDHDAAATEAAPHGEQTASAADTVQHKEQQALVQQLEHLWQFGAKPPEGGIVSRVAQRVLLRLLGPLFAQQRDFNATTVNLCYHLLAHNAEVNTRLQAVIAQIVALQRDAHARIDTISEWSETIRRDATARADRLAEFQGELSERQDILERDIHGRLDVLGAFDHEVNDRLTRLVYTVQLLDDAIATADEATAAVAAHIATLKLQLDQAGTNGAAPDTTPPERSA